MPQTHSSKHPKKEKLLMHTDTSQIESSLESGREPGLTQAFASLCKAVDLDAETKSKLSPHLCKYLTEKNKVSHIVAALRCLYIFDDMRPFKEAFLKLGKSRHQSVRLAVASRLSDFGIWDVHKEDRFGDEDIISLAISLTRDSSPSIRDWAIFQFNNGLANDSTAIRKALRDRVNDTNLAVRQEAVAALVLRGETRYYSLIKKKLKRIDAAPIWIHVAGASKYKPFKTDLEELLLKREQSQLYQSNGSIELVEEAIAALG